MPSSEPVVSASKTVLLGAAVAVLDAILFFSEEIFAGTPGWLRGVGWVVLVGSAALAAWFWVLRADRQ